jgi:UDP-galactopyranose mutase
MYDWLIVGAGFTGAVVAERFASAGMKVLVIDQRNHIGGNAYDLRTADGILYHAYGPHIFHTNSERIFRYLSRFTEWRFFEHRVLALIRNRLAPVPFNLTSIDILFDATNATRLKDALVKRYGLGANTTILKLREEGDTDLREIADFVYDNVFLGYTKKQWGMSPEELNSSVTDRVPVRVSYDDRYFQDSFQFMPLKGYTAMFQKILATPGIHVELGASWADLREKSLAKNILFTGPIDEFFDYRFGALPYRSLSFDLQTYQQGTHQPVGQINYPNAEDFTRITEMRHLTGESGDRTLIAIEYPLAHAPGVTVPYYPFPREEYERQHSLYATLAKDLKGVYFAGRLADYRYYNMDQAIGRALSFVDKFRSAKASH